MATVLIIDDSEFSRAQLTLMLRKLGHEVIVARDGREGWRRLQSSQVNLVITDWMMPEMDGLDLCRAIRAAEFEHYVYIILFSARAGKDNMVEGLEAGADDFITKPCPIQELRVKLRTGERILAYEDEMLRRTRELSEAHEEMKRGLKSVADFHHTLLPPAQQIIGNLECVSRYGVCEIAGGDMFNFIELDAHHTAFYLLDVAGHGIPAAMFSFSLSNLISPIPTERAGRNHGFLNLADPAEVVYNLNRMYQARTETWLSFTIIYGIIDQKKHRVNYVQGGHPPLIYLPKEGAPQSMGEGGFPVGFFEEANYEAHSFSFRPGDRLFLYSDGITECMNIQQRPYGQERLMERLAKERNLPLDTCLDAIRQNVEDWQDADSPTDDWALVGIGYQ